MIIRYNDWFRNPIQNILIGMGFVFIGIIITYVIIKTYNKLKIFRIK